MASLSDQPPAKRAKLHGDGPMEAFEQKCVDTIRVLAADMVQAANSGHPGAPMGDAPMAHVLWSEFIKYNAADPEWADRDRFVLSNGHCCALQYCMLHLTGYKDCTLDQLKKFRQLGSKTPGHPENAELLGVEVSTGPLGQGITNAVGMAIAETNLAATFNKPGLQPVVDHRTWVICGDGCLQEGISSEACSLAGHLGLGKLIVLYDDNKITIDGDTSLSFTEDVTKRYESYNWQVLVVERGNDSTEQLRAAIRAAKADTARPTIIRVKTTIGFGAPSKAGTHGVHGAPLGAAELAGTKKAFGFDPESSFTIADDVLSYYRKCGARGAEAQAKHTAALAALEAADPALAAEYRRRCLTHPARISEASAPAGALPAGWKDALPTYTVESKGKASRNYSEDCINALFPIMPELMGGSADLTPSNKTRAKGAVDYQKDSRQGTYLRFGVREHAMVAVTNGIFAHGGMVPFCATFLVFTGYALGAMRVTALSGFGVIFVMTHDSIGVGEDGPTHQPIEAVPTLRAMPNMLVIRPADGNETAGCWAVGVENRTRPTTMCFSRQTLPNLAGSSRDAVYKGGYIIQEAAGGAAAAQVVLVATGSEVGLCVDAKVALEAEGVPTRVVSMPCWELFEEQSIEYRRSVLNTGSGAPVLAVEASASTGWERYSHAQHCMTTYGHSGKGADIFKHFGFTPENIASKAKTLAKYFAGKAPGLLSNPFLDM